MRKEYKVEVLLSYDKHYEDSETLSFHIYMQDEEVVTEMKKEESAIKQAFEKAKNWVRPGVYHTLEIKSIEEVKNA